MWGGDHGCSLYGTAILINGIYAVDNGSKSQKDLCKITFQMESKKMIVKQIGLAEIIENENYQVAGMSVDTFDGIYLKQNNKLPKDFLDIFSIKVK